MSLIDIQILTVWSGFFFLSHEHSLSISHESPVAHHQKNMLQKRIKGSTPVKLCHCVKNTSLKRSFSCVLFTLLIFFLFFFVRVIN